MPKHPKQESQPILNYFYDKKDTFMMKKLLLVAALGSSLMAPVFAQNIATVNGTPIPVEREKFLILQIEKMNGGAKLSQNDIAQLKDNLISQEVLAQEAIKQGLDKTPEFKEQMELTRRAILLNILHEDFIKKNPITDKAIEDEYNKMIEAGSTEYLARHILVEDEAQAKDLIAKIQKGIRFADLASENSIDKGSAAEGGLLDWARPNIYVPEFAQALAELKKGEVTQTPVKSPYGWHIIKLEDVRSVNKEDFPALDDNIKAQLRNALENKTFAEYQDKLLKAADIKLAK